MSKDLINADELKSAVQEKAKFPYTPDELEKVIEESKLIVCDDLTDDASLKIVADKKKEIRSIMIENEKFGKSCRDLFTGINRDIMSMQKELTGILEPEFERFKAIEKAAEDLKIKQEREQILPWRKDELKKIGDKEEITDEELLEMDNEEFEEYRDIRIRKKKMEDEAEEKKQEEIDNAKNEEKRTQRFKRLKDIGIVQGSGIDYGVTQKDIDELNEEDFDKKVEEAKKVVAKIVEQEKKEKEDARKEELNKQENYKKWLADNGYNEENKDEFKIISEEGQEFKLYKLVSVYKLNEEK